MSTATPSSSDDAALDRVFAALSNPTRRSIVALLAGREMAVSEIAAPQSMSLPAVSKHLGILESAGLVHRRRSGRTRYCSLEPQALDVAERWIAEHRRYWEGTLDSLACHLDGEVAAGQDRV